MNTTRVCGVTRARIASTSVVRSRLRRDDRRRAAREDGDRVNQEAVLAVDRLVAGAEIDGGDQVQKLVGAGAADDAVGHRVP